MTSDDSKNKNNTGTDLRLDSDDYGRTVSDGADENALIMQSTVRSKNAGQGRFPGVTVFLILLLGAVILATLFVFKTILNTGGMMPGLESKNILGGQSSSGKTSENVEYGDYTERSQLLAALESTYEEWTNIDKNPDEKGFFCIATEDHGARMVYNIDQNHVCGDHTLRDFNYLWVDSVNTGFCCLINISGEEVDLSDYYILVHDDSGNLASRLIINCYEAKVVKLNNAIVTGTVLAPNANVEYDGTVIYGDVYAKATTGSRAYYKQILFAGYSEILKESRKITFVNPIIRRIILRWLKDNYPQQYGAYPDDYALRVDDLAKVTELVLDEETISDMSTDLDELVNLERISVRKTKLKKLDLSKQHRIKYIDVSYTDVGFVVLPTDGTILEFYADDTNIYLLDTNALKNATIVSVRNGKFLYNPLYDKLEKVETLILTNSKTDDDLLPMLKNLKNLKHLEASENPEITQIDLSCIPYVEYADFSECSISSISFAGADNLKELEINYNPISEIDARELKSLVRISAFGDYKTVYVEDESVTVSCFNTTKVVRGE